MADSTQPEGDGREDRRTFLDKTSKAAMATGLVGGYGGLGAIAVLYFIARTLAGARWGFWGVLIFIMLPRPAEYGSDALSDWPHLFFFSAALLAMLQPEKRWWLFALAGLVALRRRGRKA